MDSGYIVGLCSISSHITILILDYVCLCFLSYKAQKYSRAYFSFKAPEDVYDFAAFFNGHVFVNEKGI